MRKDQNFEADADLDSVELLFIIRADVRRVLLFRNSTSASSFLKYFHDGSNCFDCIQIIPAVRDDAQALVQLKIAGLDMSTLSDFLFSPSVYREGRRN